jgi:fructose-1,6-bisphosphatase I
MKRIISLDEFIIRKQKDFPFATGDLSFLLRDLGLAAKIVSREVNKAGLAEITGDLGHANLHGDTVQKLDILADELLISSLQNSGECCGIASEENDDFVQIKPKPNKEAKYVVIFDPLDGSSNIDCNVSIGTIFAIYRRVSKTGEPCTKADFLQRGDKQVAAGYILYGSSTMLVYTTGNGVNGFTLDPSIGEFCLSHPDIKIPEKGKIYSVNQGNYAKYNPDVQAYLNHCTNKGYSLRYIGSMVADVHRTLIKGGIFFYPAGKDAPKGKLRLLYECNPLSFLIEQAGGRASDGKNRILEIDPTDLHQRTPIFLGSPDMVEKAEEFIANFNTLTTTHS